MPRPKTTVNVKPNTRVLATFEKNDGTPIVTKVSGGGDYGAHEDGDPLKIWLNAGPGPSDTSFVLDGIHTLGAPEPRPARDHGTDAPPKP